MGLSPTSALSSLAQWPEYFFNLTQEVMVFPYGDREMDVVGPNQYFLKELYDTFGHYLIEYDSVAMDASFLQKP
ncbi:DUF3885 domain-containing protein [Salinicola halophyticus]|uniref:DUF3885 domain-containing protein n=1 Tax=Salinicola halophyticus TaxID=1808881 RepID=UPI003F4607A2